MRTIDDVVGQLVATEAAQAEYVKARSEVIRTEVPDPDVDALRVEIVASVKELVTAWELIDNPDARQGIGMSLEEWEDIGSRLRTLPEFEASRIAAYVDPDTTAAFDALVEAQPEPEWVPEVPERGDVVVPTSFDDSNIGAAFGATLAGRYLHCRALGGWLQFDGARWKRDTTEAVFEDCRQYVLELGTFLLQTGADSDDVKRVAGYRSKSRLDAVVTIARRLDGIAAEPDEFDSHPGLLCCANGVVNLETGELMEHDPALRFTKTTGTRYVAQATHKDAVKVLEVADAPERDWLQVLFGYSATGYVTEDLMPVADGRGSNGKTTILKAVTAALGEYARPAPEKLLMSGSGDEHPTLYAELFGRRLVTIEETAEGGSLRVEKMKALTGGSQITARFIARDYFTFEPTHQLFIATNHRPAVNSVEHATWRRLRLIPFPYRYERQDRLRPGDRPVDRGLRDRLTRPAQREAVLAWIVAGAVKWHADGIGTTDAIDAATSTWRNSEDVVHRFTEDRLTFTPEAHTSLSAMFDEYQQWCGAEGRPAGSQKEFGKRFEDHDTVASHHVEKRKTKTGWRWEGVEISRG